MVCWLKTVFKTYLKRNFHIISNKIYYAKGIQDFNLKSFAVQEFSTKIYPCGTL